MTGERTPTEKVGRIAAAALRYAAAGHPVLPVDAATKIPLTAHGLKDAVLDRDAVLEMWRRWPEAGVAIRCDGLLVVDVDPGGDESLQELQGRLGVLPETREQATPRGGRHLLYRLPSWSRIGNSTRRLGRPVGVDIRAGGRGYIVVAPTSSERGAYRWVNPAPIADLPLEWRRMLEPRPERPVFSEPSPLPAGSAGSRYGVAALEAEAAAVRGAGEGGRNVRLNEAAFALGQLEAGGELAPGVAEPQLVAAALAAGLSQVEAERTVRSGLGAGRSSPRSASRAA